MAKNKTKKISVSQFDKIYTIDESVKHWFFDEEKGFEVVIKPCLSLNDMVSFIDDVVFECSSYGEYSPELKSFLIKRCLLTYYANFTMPQSPKKYYEWIYSNTGKVIIDFIKEHINREQFDEICIAIDKKIEFNKDMMLSSERAELDKITQQLTSVTEIFEKLMDGVDIKTFAKSLSGIENKISSISNEEVVDTIINMEDTEKFIELPIE